MEASGHLSLLCNIEDLTEQTWFKEHRFTIACDLYQCDLVSTSYITKRVEISRPTGSAREEGGEVFV